jgi:hypothetical protein
MKRFNFRRTLLNFSRDGSGGIAVMMAVTAPVLLGVMALAADYVHMAKIREELQSAADTAALGAVKEFTLAGSTDNQVESVARSFVLANLGQTPEEPQAETQMVASKMEAAGDDGADVGAKGSAAPQVSVDIDRKSGSVRVSVEMAWTPLFLHFIGNDVTPISISSKARMVSSSPTCVLGLSKNLPSGVTLWRNANLVAKDCSIYSNTETSLGIMVNDNATLEAEVICVAGGYKALSPKSVKPSPTTDCPPLADPLVARAAPAVGACDHQNLIIINKNVTLDPGVYCGGLMIRGTSTVQLNPGVYIIKDGLFTVSDKASVTGEYVGFYLTGNATMFSFDSGTTIDLAAPKDGPLAGLLFFEDRKVTPLRIHRIGSNNARRLIGTIYLSQGTLLIDANAPVADNSAYTALIVRSLQLQEGPNVVLHSDFDATDVPVPEGLRSGQIILSQ